MDPVHIPNNVAVIDDDLAMLKILINIMFEVIIYEVKAYIHDSTGWITMDDSNIFL